MAQQERPTPTEPPEPGPHLMGTFIREMNTPIQCLGLNLSFLRHGYQRLLRVLEAHNAAAGAYPPEVAERLARVEGELDLPFLRDELPKVLAETLEGLATISRVLEAMHRANPQAH